MADCDVVIVGAGFAGAAAAIVLAERGARVAIVEARQRVGGRAFSRPFRGEDEVLEFGGAWITPWQQRIRRLAEENRIALRPRSEATLRLWHDGRTLRQDGPAGEGELLSYGETMGRIAEDAARYAQGLRDDGQGRSFASASLSSYLGRLGAGPAARSQVMAWWTISGNGDPAVVSAAEFISSCAYGGGKPEGMLDKLRHTLSPGASVLVERMIGRSRAPLQLGWPVVRVLQDADGVAVEAADGRRIESHRAILAVPLNTVGDIRFDPPLPAGKARSAARRHEGASVKVWIKARGPRVGAVATGGASGLPWMFCERSAGDDAAFVVGFGLARSRFDPEHEADVRKALAAFYPDAELLAWDWHDWAGDPYAKGTWVALPADALDIADSALWGAEGRIAFAGSDIAAEEPGWFEAAIASGEAAAEEAWVRLDPETRP